MDSTTPLPTDAARRHADCACRAGKLVTVRLVKVSYWDAETIQGEMNGWPCPVWPTKRETDACYEQMADILLAACPPSGADDARPSLHCQACHDGG